MHTAVTAANAPAGATIPTQTKTIIAVTPSYFSGVAIAAACSPFQPVLIFPSI